MIRRLTCGRLAAALLLCVAAAGCAGDGRSLVDEMMDPPLPTCPPADPGSPPTLAELQTEIFGGVCSACHIEGGIGPFRLDTQEQSFQNLVGVVSLCTLPSCAGLERVTPCDPDNSYLVWKLEGNPGIQGDRMPLGFPPLSQEQIDRVRAWIAAGALP